MIIVFFIFLFSLEKYCSVGLCLEEYDKLTNHFQTPQTDEVGLVKGLRKQKPEHPKANKGGPNRHSGRPQIPKEAHCRPWGMDATTRVTNRQRQWDPAERYRQRAAGKQGSGAPHQASRRRNKQNEDRM